MSRTLQISSAGTLDSPTAHSSSHRSRSRKGRSAYSAKRERETERVGGWGELVSTAKLTQRRLLTHAAARRRVTRGKWCDLQCFPGLWSTIGRVCQSPAQKLDVGDEKWLRGGVAFAGDRPKSGRQAYFH